MTYQDLPEVQSATDPEVADPGLRRSADPDPDAETATDRPAGLGEPAEDPDPMISGTG